MPEPGGPFLPGDRPGAVSQPFWTFEDVGLFLASILPAGFLGALLLRVTHVKSQAGKALLFQLMAYALLLAALYAIIAVRYRQPFWQSLSWSRPWAGAWGCVAFGPILAIAVSLLGAALHTPEVPNPVKELITSRATLFVVLLFVVGLGPVFEELVFRGFLLPLLIRSFGPAAGIVVTGALFGLLHGAQNQWAWQQITLIGLAGVVFGYVKYRTGSTASSTLLHATFNLTGAVGLVVQMWAQGTL